MKTIGLNKEEWQEMRAGNDSETQLSERTFNLFFGGALAWGFLLTWLLTNALQKPIMRMLLRAKDPDTIMIFIVIAYFILTITGSVLMRGKTIVKNLIGFHLIVLPVSALLTIIMLGYDLPTITGALLLTLIITGVMIACSLLFPAFFQSLGKTLGISLLCAVLVDLVAFLFFGKNLDFIDYIIAGIMALYIGFDWGRASTCYRTPRNAIMVASSLYLDIVNLFVRLLAIIAKKRK